MDGRVALRVWRLPGLPGHGCVADTPLAALLTALVLLLGRVHTVKHLGLNHMCMQLPVCYQDRGKFHANQC